MPRPHEMTEREIDDQIALWQDGAGALENLELYEWLGWSPEDYIGWLEGSINPREPATATQD